MATMKKRMLGVVTMAALGLAVFGPQIAQAGTSSSTFTVSTTVNSPCTITTTNLKFPNYTSGQRFSVAGTTDFSLSCPGATAGTPTPVTLTFTTTSGVFAMTNGASSLAYQLCDGSDCTWGYTPSVRGPVINVTSSAQTYTVYGWINPNQPVPGGLPYSQSVTATLEF
jgi:hypothetical protein